MANSNKITIKGNQNIVWGTGEVGGSGIVMSASQKRGGEKATIKDEDGNTICVIYFDENDAFEVDAIFQTSVTLPARGDLVTVCAVVGALVEEWELKWEAGKEKMYTLRAVKYKYLVNS